jgi:diguanylate cyclase (GGDEF)-like protein
MAEREDLLPELWDDERDVVTGLATRAAWGPRLVQEMLRAARFDQSLCVAIVDLDNLKAVNDEHGRLAGDSLLRRATDSWVGSIRSTDSLIRLDAHKFGLVLPDCTACTADRVLGRMTEGMPRGHSFSAGIAPWREDDTIEDLERRAYEALSRAKTVGCAPIQVAGMPGQRDPGRR